MHVLINMPSQYAARPSGVANVVFGLLAHWCEHPDFRFTLLSPWARNDLPKPLDDCRLQVITRPRPRWMILDVARQAIELPDLCEKLQIDVMLNADPFGAPRGAPARTTIVHDLYFETLPAQISPRARFTMKLAYECVLRNSTNIVTVSDATRRDLARWRPAFAAVARTIHSDAVAPPPVVPPDRGIAAAYVLLVGNATPNKNFPFAARVLAQLGERHPHIEIVHVGHDPDGVLRRALEEQASPLRLHLLSGVSTSELRRLYLDAACLLVTSVAEGFCLPIIEAQDAGCPVVCPNASAMPEIGGNGVCVFPAGDVVKAVHAVEQLLEETDVRRALIARGRLNRQRFSWARAADDYLETFQSAAAVARARR